MRYPRTDIGSLCPCWGKDEQPVAEHVPLMTRIELSHNSEILGFDGNPASYVQADGSGSMSSALSG